MIESKKLTRVESAQEQQPAITHMRLDAEQLELGAKKLAELFDYPWEFMPDKGKQEMRSHVQKVLDAAMAKNTGAHDD